ncbi:MAG: PQQ-binding-like beta-propeller repeat protein [Planctomycetes bacterium]|nr:PQQ-binding-like beta-propeller repeat protein [Planctomycetota bacterium]MBL7037479.1 PQQ-binding-like beta-propeller repeat protein [Pirellulaceae bacterium]
MIHAARTAISLCVGIPCVVVFLAWGTILQAADLQTQDDTSKMARQILEAAEVTGGVIVHVGCDDGRLTAALRVGDGFLVHGLDADAESVRKAREHIRSLGLYGKVSVEQWQGKQLPYVDDLVKLVVMRDAGYEIRDEEIQRVLAPGGVAIFLNRQSEIENRKWVKPWPEEIDEWTHWLHDADGNAVANDTRVGPPGRIQWIAEPFWQRHHDGPPAVSAMVSARGRLFYILDETPTGVFASPEKWSLIARDAFNGVLLWKKPLPDWGGPAHGTWLRQDKSIPYRLVAAGNTIYVTLGFNAPVSALDAQTGDVLRTYEDTEDTQQILLHDGALVLAVRQRDTGNSAERGAPTAVNSVVAVDPDTGSMKWKSEPFGGLPYLSSKTYLPLVAGDGKVYVLDANEIVCLDANGGEVCWRLPRPDHVEVKNRGFAFHNVCSLAYYDKVLVLTQPTEPGEPYKKPTRTAIFAVDAEAGSILWSAKCGGWPFVTSADAFGIDGLIWTVGDSDFSLVGFEARTGKVKETIDAADAFFQGHHHRCYRNKATPNYIFTGRRGIESTELATGDVKLHHWTRGGCRYGILPCNGLIYAPPDACVCYISAKLAGFYAFAPESSEKPTPRANSRLEKGPDYGLSPAANLPQSSEEWPTYRFDPQRSCATPATGPSDLSVRWRTDIGCAATSPVVAEGKVFFGATDRHAVWAVDADSGERSWSYVTGGPIDSPPTIYKGLALCGSRDGWAYALNAGNGKLVYRFRGAPAERRIVALDRLESPWPVHGSILVTNGVAYLTAGRQSFVDGGIFAYALDPFTGRTLQKTQVFSPELQGIEQKEYETRSPQFLVPLSKFYDMPSENLGAVSDILTADGGLIYMRNLRLDPKDISRPVSQARETIDARFGGGVRQDPVPGPQVVSDAGFLDGSWFNQVYWTYRNASRSKLLVFDDTTTYGVRARDRKSRSRHDRYRFQPGKGYTLFAYNHETNEEQFAVDVQVRIQAMVLAGDKLYVAGTLDMGDPADPWAFIEGSKGGVLCVYSASDGAKQQETDLENPPVFNGMCVAGTRLYMSTIAGTVVCVGQ